MMSRGETYRSTSRMPPKTKLKSASQETSPKSESQSSEQFGDGPALRRRNKEKCPSCKDDDDSGSASTSKENWVRCDACKKWFHWRCIASDVDLESIDKWQVDTAFIRPAESPLTLVCARAFGQVLRPLPCCKLKACSHLQATGEEVDEKETAT